MKRELLEHFYKIGASTFQMKLHDFEYLFGTMKRFRTNDGSWKHPNDIETELLQLQCKITKSSNEFISDDPIVNDELMNVNRFSFTWHYTISVLNDFPDLLRQIKSGNNKVKNVIIGKAMQISNHKVYADEVMWCLQEFIRCY